MDRLLNEQAILKIIDSLKANFTCYDSVTLDEVYSHVKDIPPEEPKYYPPCEDCHKKMNEIRKAYDKIQSAEPSRDVKEIEEVINCDADAETKCKMISNILTAKPHYFEKQESKKCKDCKWWRDSDGVYRRGVKAESRCPINSVSVCNGWGYCYMFEPQESEEME